MDYPLSFTTRDGHVYEGDTAFQVIDAMRADSMMQSHKSLDTYMTSAAERFARFENITVRTDSPENFLADLVSSGTLVATKK